MFICTYNNLDDKEWPLPPPHTISISIMNTGLRHSSGMLNFFCPLLYNYLLLESLCVQNHNQDDNSEWPPPLGQQTGTRDVSSASQVSGMFFLFIIIIFSIYLDASTTTTTTLSNRSSRCIMS